MRVGFSPPSESFVWCWRFWNVQGTENPKPENPAPRAKKPKTEETATE